MLWGVFCVLGRCVQILEVLSYVELLFRENTESRNLSKLHGRIQQRSQNSRGGLLPVCFRGDARLHTCTNCSRCGSLYLSRGSLGYVAVHNSKTWLAHRPMLRMRSMPIYKLFKFASEQVGTSKLGTRSYQVPTSIFKRCTSYIRFRAMKGIRLRTFQLCWFTIRGRSAAGFSRGGHSGEMFWGWALRECSAEFVCCAILGG